MILKYILVLFDRRKYIYINRIILHIFKIFTVQEFTLLE